MTEAVWAIASMSPRERILEATINRSQVIRAQLSRQTVASQSTTAHDKTSGAMGTPSGRPFVASSSLTEEDRAVCRSMGMSHEQFLATRNGAPLAALSAPHTPSFAGGNGSACGGLGEDELAVCRSMGISPEQFLASKNGAPTASLSATPTSDHFGGRGGSSFGLSEFEMAVCASLGVSHTDFVAIKRLH